MMTALSVCPECGALLINDGRCPRGHGQTATEAPKAPPKRRGGTKK